MAAVFTRSETQISIASFKTLNMENLWKIVPIVRVREAFKKRTTKHMENSICKGGGLGIRGRFKMHRKSFLAFLDTFFSLL